METMLLEKRDGMYDLRPLINWLSQAHDGTYKIPDPVPAEYRKGGQT